MPAVRPYISTPEPVPYPLYVGIQCRHIVGEYCSASQAMQGFQLEISDKDQMRVRYQCVDFGMGATAVRYTTQTMHDGSGDTTHFIK